VLWYNSANRDDSVWTNPYEFDVRRSLQPQQAGFGAGGPHFCLGANLARMEVTTVFQELLTRLPDIEVPEGITPDRGDSSLVLALQHMPATFTPGECPVAH
jgi:cytochrome P450